MQPQEFNAFVAAIVSARQTNLITHKLACEVVEQQAQRYLTRFTVGPTPNADTQETMEVIAEALNGRR